MAGYKIIPHGNASPISCKLSWSPRQTRQTIYLPNKFKIKKGSPGSGGTGCGDVCITEPSTGEAGDPWTWDSLIRLGWLSREL